MFTENYGERSFAGRKTEPWQAALLIFAFAFAQTALLGEISPSRLKPELLLILSCYFLLYHWDGEALIAVFLLGLMNDAYSMVPFGLTSFSFLAMGAMLLKVRGKLIETNLITWCAVLGGATLLNGALHILALRLILWEPLPVLDFLGRLPLLLLINVSVGVPLFLFLFRPGDGSIGPPWRRIQVVRGDMSSGEPR